MDALVTTLTVAESIAYGFAFGYYFDEGATEAEADRWAWEDIQQEFPRLQRFEGCLA